MKKLRGCRPSTVVMQDYSNVAAQLGDTIFQIHRGHEQKQRGHEQKQRLLKRQHELFMEMNAAQDQEREIANKRAGEDAEIKAEGVMPDAPLEVVANG